MTFKAEKIYVFEEFRLEPDKRGLFRANGRIEPIKLANRPFQVLLYLIENRDRFVTRGELLNQFWDGRDVYDAALTKAVGAVRKALSENPDEPRFIETRWAEGYRFVGEVEEQPVYQEVERTREIKVVIEEDFEPSGAAPEPKPVSNRALPAKSPAKFIESARLRLVATVVFAVLALAVIYNLTRPWLRISSTKNTSRNSIAVLPLKNLSGNRERDLFVEGMSESLINSLSKIKGLKVISRNSSFAFKDVNAAPNEIAERLGAATYLEGSFRESGDKIRVEVRLVSSDSGEILWSGDDFERKLGDVFEIQDEIARRVATQLRLQLSSAEEQSVVKRQTSSVEAYQNYVKGRYFWKKKTPADLEKARKFLETAIAQDPNYALAYAGLADYYLTGIWYADFPAVEATEKARMLVEKALELDEQSAEAHRLRSKMAQTAWDWESCRREIEKAIELNPNEANYWQSYAFVLRNFEGKYDEAVTAMRHAAELDPLSPSINTDVGVMLMHAGELEQAIPIFKKTLETDPQFQDVYWNLAIAYERRGMFAEAVKTLLEKEKLSGTSEERLSALRTAFARGGMRGFWRQELEFLTSDAKSRNIPSNSFATLCARAGEKDQAFVWLEKSFAAREIYLVNLKSDFAFDSLRTDERFKDLLRRVGLDK